MRVDENGKLLSVGEQIDIACYQGSEALKKFMQRIRRVSQQIFWVGVRDHLNVHIKITEAGLAANKNVIGFNAAAVEFVLSHYYNIKRFIETKILS